MAKRANDICGPISDGFRHCVSHIAVLLGLIWRSALRTVLRKHRIVVGLLGSLYFVVRCRHFRSPLIFSIRHGAQTLAKR